MKIPPILTPEDKPYIKMGFLWWIITFVSGIMLPSDNPLPKIFTAPVYFIQFIPRHTTTTFFSILSYLTPTAWTDGYTVGFLGEPRLVKMVVFMILVTSIHLVTCILFSVFFGRFYRKISQFVEIKGLKGVLHSEELKIVIVLSVITSLAARFLPSIMGYLLSGEISYSLSVITYEVVMLLFGIAVGIVRGKDSFYVCFAGRIIPVTIFLVYDVIQAEYYGHMVNAFQAGYYGVLSALMCGCGGILGFKIRQRM